MDRPDGDGTAHSGVLRTRRRVRSRAQRRTTAPTISKDKPRDHRDQRKPVTEGYDGWSRQRRRSSATVTSTRAVRPASSANVWVTPRCTAWATSRQLSPHRTRSSPARGLERRERSRAARPRREPAGRGRGDRDEGGVRDVQGDPAVTPPTGPPPRCRRAAAATPTACSPAAKTVCRTRAAADARSRPNRADHGERDVGGRVRPRLRRCGSCGRASRPWRRRRRAARSPPRRGPAGWARAASRAAAPPRAAARCAPRPSPGPARPPAPAAGTWTGSSAMRCTATSSRRASA